MLYLQDGVSESMLEDINSFNYTWLLNLVRRMNWGEEVTNLLLVGMQDVVTPAHFDILENLYVQVSIMKVGFNCLIITMLEGSNKNKQLIPRK